MNLVFHTVFSISTSSICAKNIESYNKPLKYLAWGFVGNLIGHGVMDLIPHDYPLTVKIDIPISLAIFLLSIIFIKKEFIFSVSLCFLGGVFPDLIDKAFLPMLGLGGFKIFPWHWRTVINIFYKWYFHYKCIFKVFNILVIIVSLGILLMNRKFIVQFMLRNIKEKNNTGLTK